MKKRILLASFLSFMCLFAYSQTTMDVINGSVYENQVKIIDEFFFRFNNDSIKKTESGSDSIDFLVDKFRLFDLEQFKSEKDSSFACAVDFVNAIKENKVKLRYSDSLWYADVKANIVLNGKKKHCNLNMRYVQRGSDMYKWVIEDVVFDKFTLNSAVPDLFIKPVAHEMEFLELRKDVNEYSANINSFFPDAFAYNNLSVFAFLVSNKYLTFESVADLKFVFNQVPGYRFIVSYFPRETQNSGWLIEKIEKK